MLRKVVHKIAMRSFLKRTTNIQKWLNQPLKYQEIILKELLYKARNTHIGKIYGFNEIKNYDSFKERVPLFEYENLLPYFDKITSQQNNILWNSKIQWFAKSSGTTDAKSKYIPVSIESLTENHFKGGRDLLTFYFNANPKSKFFEGRLLALGGTLMPHPKNSCFICGDVSAILMKNMPDLARFSAALSQKTALMANWEEKIESMIKETAKLNVTALLGVPTWTLVLIRKLFECYPQASQNLHKIWPNLEVFIHGAVNFEPYQAEFNRIIPSDNMYYWQTYNASEGFFAVQMEGNTKDMALLVNHGIFYEFLDPKKNTVCALNEVELNKPYILIITTNAGLWRYNLGDVIHFTSRNPYKIKVIGRSKLYINAFGEELMIHNTDTAIKIACEKTNAILKDYTAAPVYFTHHQAGRHQWFVEFVRKPNDTDAFVKILDQTLKSLNSDYEAKRYKNMTIQEPELIILPEGTFDNWLKKHNKLGGQHKIPRLNNDRKFVEQLLEFMELSK
ncbi:MAG: GH3 auxin-responsive promoter family protein [Bacteroidia bacterium]|nr:GH3 auxin-responsive promoter family protein [Bacteroidia bacterium]MDW8347782.1 GH3 auxin-responsive promoter family protein [Bacteroidia bacterium]